MTGEIISELIMGLLVLLVVAYLAPIFLPRQLCPQRNQWFSLPKLVEQKGDRELVQCRRCNHAWERFSYGGGVGSSSGDGGTGGGDGGSVG